MPTKSHTVLGGLLALLIAALIVTILFTKHDKAEAGAFLTAPTLAVATTTGQTSVTTSTRILATTTNSLDPTRSYTRVYASICNANSNPVALNLDADKAANSSTGNMTVWIAAAAGYNVCYEITDRNYYQGSITASSTNQTATVVTYKDYVY